MAWLESHQSLARHPKVVRLASLLHVTKADAIGRLHLLWWWALDYAQDGNLSAFSNAEIAAASEWNKDSEVFVRALLTCKLLDEDRSIHDWNDYAGRLIEVRRKDRERKQEVRRKSSGSPVDVRPPSVVPNPTQPNSTQPDQTKPESPPTPQGGDEAGLFPDLPPTAPPPQPNGLHPEQLRLNAIFGRRPSTGWSAKELRAWKSISPIAEDDFRAVERYYGTTFPPSEKDIRRRDLFTLLNNWRGEVDRAKNYVRPSCL